MTCEVRVEGGFDVEEKSCSVVILSMRDFKVILLNNQFKYIMTKLSNSMSKSIYKQPNLNLCQFPLNNNAKFINFKSTSI